MAEKQVDAFGGGGGKGGQDEATTLPVDNRARQTGAALRPTRRTRLPKESNEKGPQVNRPEVLPAAFGTCSNRLLPTRPDDGLPESRIRRVLVVQLREEAVTTPPFHGVSSLDAPD